MRLPLSPAQEAYLHALGETNAPLGAMILRFLLLGEVGPHEIPKYTWEFSDGAVTFTKRPEPAPAAKSPAGKRVKGAP